MPTQASAASNHKEEEPTAASSSHVSLLIAPLEALCAQPLSLPWLQPLHVWATHWLALMARMSPTSQGPLKGTAAACAAPGYCFNTVVFISVYVSGALWSLSPLHGGNLASVCSLSFMGQPKPLREAPPAGGGWRGLCCDHDRPWLWQMAKRSIIGISAAACNCKRSI